uniref:EGF-like domain-containing protein n=1 Tax=Eptatretus burgeri TaxID=7764 RepID=A0A8C4QGA4_EPTBU
MAPRADHCCCVSVTLDWCRRLKPCRHGARCENLQTTFRCHCRPGWAGPSCQHGLADVAPVSFPHVHGAVPPAKDEESSPSTSVTISIALPVGATNIIDPELEVVHSNKKENRPEFNLSQIKNQQDTIVYNPKVQNVVKEVDQNSKLVPTVERLPSTRNVTSTPEPNYSIELDAEQSSDTGFAFSLDHTDFHSGLSTVKPSKGAAETLEVDFTTPICKDSSCPLNSAGEETPLSSTMDVVVNGTNEIHPHLSVVLERFIEKDVDNRTFEDVSSTLWGTSSSMNTDHEHSDTVAFTPSIMSSQLMGASREATARSRRWGKTSNDDVDVQHLKQKASIVEDKFSQEPSTQSSAIQKDSQLVDAEILGTIEALDVLKPNMKRKSQILLDGISSHISTSPTNNNHDILKIKIKEIDYDWMSKSTFSLGIGLQAMTKAIISKELQKPLKSDDSSQPTLVKRISDITTLEIFTSSPLKGLLSITGTLKNATRYSSSTVSTPKTSSTKINSAISADFKHTPSHRQIESPESTSVSHTFNGVTDSAHALRFDLSSSQPTRLDSSAVLDADLNLQRVTEPYLALSRGMRKLTTNPPKEFNIHRRNGFTQNTSQVPVGQHQQTVEYPKFTKPPEAGIPTSLSYQVEKEGTLNSAGLSSDSTDTSITNRWSSSNLLKLPTSVSTSHSLLIQRRTSEIMKSTSFGITIFLGTRDDRVSVLYTSRGTKRYLPSDGITTTMDAKVSYGSGVLETSDQFSKDDLTAQQTSGGMSSMTVTTPFGLHIKSPRLHLHAMPDTSWTKKNYSYLGSTRPFSWPKSLGDLKHLGNKERFRFDHNMAPHQKSFHVGHNETVTSPSVAVQLGSLMTVPPSTQTADLSNTVPSKGLPLTKSSTESGFQNVYVPQKTNGLFGSVKLDLTTVIPEFETSSAVTSSKSRIFPGTLSRKVIKISCSHIHIETS